MRIGFDLDGVLANFSEAFLSALRSAGAQIPADLGADFPKMWDWPEHYGATAAQVGKAWELVWESSYFWQNLDYLQGRETIDVIRDLNDARRRGHDVYFITHRSGKRAKQQTEEWLRNGGFCNPTVLMAGDKGLAAKVLDLHLYVDDRTENCHAVQYHLPSCSTYVFDQPYNQACTAKRTGNLQEMLEHELRVRNDQHDGPGVLAGTAQADSGHHRYRV